VDLAESFLCGYLRINGLTEEYPELTTYFEAEIIGPKHSFLTRKWDADELIDEEHWVRLLRTGHSDVTVYPKCGRSNPTLLITSAVDTLQTVRVPS